MEAHTTHGLVMPSLPRIITECGIISNCFIFREIQLSLDERYNNADGLIAIVYDWPYEVFGGRDHAVEGGLDT
jgi:hypothetical protein